MRKPKRLKDYTRIATAIVAVLLSLSAHADRQDHNGPISFASLLDEMIDADTVARWPDPPFTLKQVSSYDRRSKTPGNEDWFANEDWSNFIRAENVKTAGGARTEYVMLDENGPGAIVRMWVGGFTDLGIVRFYIDGVAEPVLAGVADKIIGDPQYFPEPFAATRARGLNLYAPIPYAEHIKISYDGPLPRVAGHASKERFFYNINYRTYSADTRVHSFSLTTLATMTERLSAVAKAMSDRDRLEYQKAGRLTPNQSFRATCSAPEGPAAIARLQLRIRAPDMESALRQTVLSLTFDGHRTVQVPIGDFFGSGVGLNPFEDRWRRIDSEGNLMTRWVMPYRERCEVELSNYGQQTVEYEYADSHKAWEWDKRSLYFHAQWHCDSIDASKPTDFNFLNVHGSRGVYVGDTLAVFNPIHSWWGEGDEKIWVDGESFPSHFGTGTEDYYGYAWGDTHTFFSPFHAQPRAGSKTQGHTTNTRVRVLDRIPFHDSIKFDMEVWHWCNATPGCIAHPVKLDYAAATFWYGDAVGTVSARLDSGQHSVHFPPHGYPFILPDRSF